MKDLAIELLEKIGIICIDYYYLKKHNIVDEAEKLAGSVQKFAAALIQGINEQTDTGEEEELQNYILAVLKDYIEAIDRKDEVLMVNTLDFGLRELLDIFNENKN